MRIIKPSATLMEHNVPPYEFIERVGRTCYKSEDLITEGSDEKFVKGLVNRQHWAILEHETLFLEVSDFLINNFLFDMQEHLNALKFFNITYDEHFNIISGSFRSFHDLFENKAINSDSVRYMESVLRNNYPLVFGEFEDTKSTIFFECDCLLHSRKQFVDKFRNRHDILSRHLTHTFLFVCDRGVSHEFVRHRVASFAQESTRYCNYSKNKFGEEITVIEPCFFEKGSDEYKKWRIICDYCEIYYFDLLRFGATPQEARSVLPNSLKTEIIITATEEEWQHIVNLRYLGTTGAPHPQIKEVMCLILADLVIQSGGRISVDKGEK